MIWIFHFLSVSLLLLISRKIENDDFFIKSSFIYAVFIFGQRWMTGTDFPNYLRYYLTGFQVREPLYRGLQNFLATNNLYFGLLIFFTALISIYNNFRFIKKVDKYVVYIIFFYLLSEIFFTQLSQIRQFIAISFFINSYYHSFHDEKWRSFLNLLLGLGFHTSILFMLPFLFIKLNITRIKAMYILLVATITPLIDIKLILKIPIFSRYSRYLDSIFNVNLSIFHLFKFYALLTGVALFFWSLKKYQDKRMDQMILNGILINMLLYGLSFQFAPLLRVAFYFKIFEIVFLVYYIKNIRYHSMLFLKTVIISFFLLVYTGLFITDPFEITRYEFRPLRITETKTDQELLYEVDTFYD